jgi:hypothetical protein
MSISCAIRTDKCSSALVKLKRPYSQKEQTYRIESVHASTFRGCTCGLFSGDAQLASHDQVSPPSLYPYRRRCSNLISSDRHVYSDWPSRYRPYLAILPKLRAALTLNREGTEATDSTGGPVGRIGNVDGSARRGQNGGPQGPLCHWLMAAETSPDWQVGAPTT